MRSWLAMTLNRLRGLVPPRLVPLFVTLQARRAVRSPARMADARAQMRFLLGDHLTDAEVDPVARAYVWRSLWRGEVRWHPAMITRQEVIGLEHLQRAAAGGGCLVNFVHLGDYEGLAATLVHRGVPVHVVATSEAWNPDAPVWFKGYVRLAVNAGVRLVDVAQGSREVHRLLAAGEVVSIATDQPGRTPVRFLDRDLTLSSGIVWIAREARVPIVCVRSEPDPDNPSGVGRLRVHEPIDPHDFETGEELLDHLLRIHEETFRNWPESAEHPLRMTDTSLVRGEPSPRPE